MEKTTGRARPGAAGWGEGARRALTIGAWLVCAGVWGELSAQGAAEAPEEVQHPFGLSDYEWRLVERTMARHGLEALSQQEATGRPIEAIIVEPEGVFTPEDLFPDALNMFHATSLPSVIRREVLFEEGDPYDPELAAQSERNLRGPPVLAVALVLPMRGQSPGSVRLLVVTKDIWSLRTNFNFQVVGGVLDFLSVSLSENNIAGAHKFAALTMLLQPATIRLGESYLDPRLLGSRLQLSESFSVPLNLDTGEAEGFTALLNLQRPLFSLKEQWGWEVQLIAHTAIGRSFLGGQLRGVNVPEEPPPLALPIAGLGAGLLRDPVDLLLGLGPGPLDRFTPPTPGVVVMPFIFRERIFEAQASLTRSFGLKVKHDASIGYEIGVRRFAFGQDEAQRDSFAAAQVARFEGALLPRSERVGAVFTAWRVFTPDFVQMRNFETLALPEDFRFGPSLELTARHADPLLGSEARFETFSASYTHRWRLGGAQNPSRDADVLILNLSASTRLQSADFIDNALRASLRNYTPVWLFGRLVWEGVALHRIDDQSNSLTSVGGDSGLRGFEIGQFLGRSVLTSNLEWRTMPWELYTLQLGLVAFHDVAGIAEAEDLSDLRLFQSVGIGGRLLNPISNRIVIRADWGLGLDGPGAGLPGRFSFGFEQAF